MKWEEAAARLWNRGKGTKEIALSLGSTEAEVYNRLGTIKTVARYQRAPTMRQLLQEVRDSAPSDLPDDLR